MGCVPRGFPVRADAVHLEARAAAASGTPLAPLPHPSAHPGGLSGRPPLSYRNVSRSRWPLPSSSEPGRVGWGIPGTAKDCGNNSAPGSSLLAATSDSTLGPNLAPPFWSFRGFSVRRPYGHSRGTLSSCRPGEGEKSVPKGCGAS